MRSHFEEIRQIELALLFGDLDTARFHARALATMPQGVGEAELQPISLARVREVALRVASADAVEAALPLVADLAGECGRCHQASSASVRIPQVAEPGEDGSLASRMERHQWAADRIWEGLVTPSRERWQEGLVVLGEAPLPPDGVTDDRSLYPAIERLGRQLAVQAMAARDATAGDGQTRTFGAMLKVCSACHVLIRGRSE